MYKALFVMLLMSSSASFATTRDVVDYFGCRAKVAEEGTGMQIEKEFQPIVQRKVVTKDGRGNTYPHYIGVTNSESEFSLELPGKEGVYVANFRLSYVFSQRTDIVARKAKQFTHLLIDLKSCDLNGKCSSMIAARPYIDVLNPHSKYNTTLSPKTKIPVFNSALLEEKDRTFGSVTGQDIQIAVVCRHAATKYFDY